jgi:Methylene-tetrahydrofolate reductase C terminal
MTRGIPTSLLSWFSGTAASPDRSLCVVSTNRVCETLWSSQDAICLATMAAFKEPKRMTDLPHPFRPRTRASAMYTLHHFLDRRNPVWSLVGQALLKAKPVYSAFTAAERLSKNRLFGCRMCGQCALPVTAYACPMTCPKQLRNGPCGGVNPDGGCEVYPDQRCVWVMAYERADAEGHTADMRRLQRPIDQRKWGQSSWVNYWVGEDEDLWTAEDVVRGEREPKLLVERKPGGGQT